MTYGDRLPVATELANGALTVRLIRRSDAEPLRALLAGNRPWLSPWEATHPNGGGAEPGSFPLGPAIRASLRQYRRGTQVPYVLEIDGRIAGQLTVSEVSQGALRSCQIGYWIAQEFAGRGAMPVAVALVIDALFECGMHRVEICIVPSNQPSLRVVEKLGLRFEGRRERYINIAGRWCDHDSFAVTVEEVDGTMIERVRDSSKL